MQQQVLYRDLAKYYDLIYAQKDYQKEGALLTKLIAKYKRSKGKELLEVACGTGKHLTYLQEKFSCTGLDINPGMLDIARKKLRNVTLRQANMINFQLPKKFDVITCLFSSIGYVKTYANLKRTIRNFAWHLKPGGMVIIEPWLTKAVYRPGSPHMGTYEDKDLKIARLVVSKVQGEVSVMDMHFLIAERNKEVKHFVDRHELGMFDTDETLRSMRAAGLKAKFLKKGLLKERGLFIGVKR